MNETSLEERTLIVFMSDNGGPTRELTSSNRPLRGGKGDVYEGGIRVPFLCQWKGTLPAGQVFQQPVVSLDVFATAAQVAETPLPSNRSLDGVNLLPYLKQQIQGRPHEVLFWRMNQRTAVRVGDWKLLRNPGRGQDNHWHLYDLARDISEANDLASTHQEVQQQLRRTWERVNAEMIDPIWIPRRR